ncbi:MAG TPA: Maf family protein [Acidimicrobiales bacterium]
MTERLVLASGSPRRFELLAGLGLQFEIRPADLDESHPDFEPGPMYVGRLARAKAAQVARPDDVVIAADTTVDLDGELLGKPTDADAALVMLRRLSGRTHHVHTGVCVHRATEPTPEIRSQVVTTAVTFAELPDTWIDWYVETGEPFDKAGGYGMQGSAALFVARIEGSPTNVIGLPLDTLFDLMTEVGTEPFSFSRSTP